jgi:Sensors of blue-light using FAD
MLRADVESILITSRRYNEANGINGLLVSSPAHFMQILEGDETQVRDIYAQICKDPRHRAQVILRQAEVEERQFSQWTMACEFFSDGDFSALIAGVRTAIAQCDVITKAYLLGFVEQRSAA